MEWVAHTPSHGKWHSYQDHVVGVTDLAVEFARPFGGDELVRYLSLLHDLGKLTPAFQDYLRKCAAGVQLKPGSAPHKQHGALAIMEELGLTHLAGIAEVVASLAHGHHGGINDASQMRNDITGKHVDSPTVAELRILAAGIAPRFDPKIAEPDKLFPVGRLPNAVEAEMFFRFVYSALVDADCLDTESHFQPDATAKRKLGHESISNLRDAFLANQTGDFSNTKTSPVNSARASIYQDCIKAAAKRPGPFALTVPTGAGKTRSSLAFALEHASKNGLSRVIYAIPFTSIVDQTADVFRSIFKDFPEAVLEHHSAIDPNRAKNVDADQQGGPDEENRRLATQNWDAPIIVTTTVQLFESLFSNRASACRKVHNIANSVIVLDEVQTLPSTLLGPLRSCLRSLVDHFGCTVVFCTATQPALTQSGGYLTEFGDAVSIVDLEKVKEHFRALKRVHYRFETDPWSWKRVADEMREGDRSTLCIVNTRKHALDLLKELDSDSSDTEVKHLSTLMCGAHRKAVLAGIRRDLKANKYVQVVSTQLIEAGVDVDFPRVLRALGPLDRIVQAAGRCNREGLRLVADSEVVIFTPEFASMPPGAYEMAASDTSRLLARALALGEELDLDDPDVITRHFSRLYSDLGQRQLDVHRVQSLRESYNYPEVAKKMRLIDSATTSVMVMDYDYGAAQAIRAKAEAIGKMTRELWREAQPYTVSIYSKYESLCEELSCGLTIWSGKYDPKTGIELPVDPADGFAYDPKKLFA